MQIKRAFQDRLLPPKQDLGGPAQGNPIWIGINPFLGSSINNLFIFINSMAFFVQLKHQILRCYAIISRNAQIYR